MQQEQDSSAKVQSKFFPTELLEHFTAGALKKLNLLSREEFDIQTKVLQRTREKVELLEQKIAALHSSLNVGV